MVYTKKPVSAQMKHATRHYDEKYLFINKKKKTFQTREQPCRHAGLCRVKSTEGKK